MSPAGLAAALERRSGLLGLAGTADMRQVPARAAVRDTRTELAREVYLHRLRGLIASMTAAMDGTDAIAFTGGVGENSAEVRGLLGHNARLTPAGYRGRPAGRVPRAGTSAGRARTLVTT